MSTSVLGKRSRRVIDAEDIVPEIRLTKRRTRRSTPSIYEDGNDADRIQANAVHFGTSQSQQSISRVTRAARQQHKTRSNVNKNEPVNKERVCQVLVAEDAMEVENIPPSEASTPSTIRFTDLLGVKIPTTPKRRVRVAGGPLTPKSLQRASSSPRPRSIFSTARQLFIHSSHSKKLIGRDTERQAVQQFISQAINLRTGGCTYVSGAPGTGKSALVQEVLHDFESDDTVQISVINCISLRTASDIYNKLTQEFSSDVTVKSSNPKQFLANLFLKSTSDKLQLVLLDEIDSLLDSECDVLSTIFEWAMHKSSSLILIGIANALDLTDRFLPRLKAKGLKPNLLPFLPYTAPQISTILSDKLCSLLSEDASVSKDFVPLMHPAAVHLCGKKIAAQTGDLRKAFSLVRRIIDQLETEITNKAISTPTKKPLGELSNLSSLPLSHTATPSKLDREVSSFTAETAPRATIAHVAKLASGIFNSGTLSRLSGLNLQQKAVLCSLVSGEKRKAERNPYLTPSKSTNKVPTIKEMFVKYSMLCKRDEGLLQPLKDTEFRDVVASLETLGLVHEQRGRTSSLLTPTSTPSRTGRNSDDRQIVSAVSENEMRESLSGAGSDLLRRLLDEHH